MGLKTRWIGWKTFFKHKRTFIKVVAIILCSSLQVSLGVFERKRSKKIGSNITNSSIKKTKDAFILKVRLEKKANSQSLKCKVADIRPA